SPRRADSKLLHIQLGHAYEPTTLVGRSPTERDAVARRSDISVVYGRTPTRLAEWYRRRQDPAGSVVTGRAPGGLVVCPCPPWRRQPSSSANCRRSRVAQTGLR